MSQVKSCDIQIYIDEYKIYSNFNIVPDTNIEKLYDDYSFKAILSDCRGELLLQGYKNKILILEGNYVNSPDTLKGCFNVTDSDTFEQEMVVEYYFFPLKDGEWKYYNSKGKLIRKEIWKKGIKMDTQKR